MNRRKLEALLKAGLITPIQFAAATRELDAAGNVTTPPTLDMHVVASPVRLEVSTDDDGNTVGGVLTADTVTRYDELIESHGMIIHAGALVPREPIIRNKILRDHNHAEPVGYMLDVDDARQAASWQIASSEIERVQQEYDEHLRDGLSVGFTIHEYEIDDDWILHVYRADWYETSLCAIPAVQEAGVSSVAAALATARKEDRTMNRAQLAAALAAGQITQDQHDAAIAALDAVEASTAPGRQQGAPAEVVAGPEQLGQQPASHAQINERLTLRQVNERLATAANTGDMRNFQLALADILPADDAGAAFLREDWQGEAWRNDDETRPWIDAFGAPAELTALNGKGWEWGEPDVNGDGGEPQVDEYAGNKTDVPTNEIGTEPKTYNGFRIAAGWDVERAFVDFASEEFWGSFWPATMRSYKRKSNAGIRTRVLAKASAPAGTVTTGGVKAVVKQLIRDVRPFGKVNRIFLGDTLFEELEDLDTENLPLWLKSAIVGLDIAEGSANIGELRILNDPDLPDLEAVAFDSRAGKVREKAPFRLEAVNIPKGGVDVGIYSYLRFDDYDTRAIVKRTYVPAP